MARSDVPQDMPMLLSSRSVDSSFTGRCSLVSLPLEILQMITGYLHATDLHALCRTCRALHDIIDQNSFWMHHVRSVFSASIAQFYLYDLFKTSELVPSYDRICPSGFHHTVADRELDRLAIQCATHYNDEAVEKRQERMFVAQGAFADRVEFYQYRKPVNGEEIPLAKLIYFYLRDRKRCAAVDMHVIHRNGDFLVEEEDVDSFKGRVIHLRSACWLEITGHFEHTIMPGIYDVRWRMKGDAAGVHVSGETEFIVVPQHGKLLIHRMSADDFQKQLLEHETRWFIVEMGQILIYEPSQVSVAIRNWIDRGCKSGLSWDFVELTLATLKSPSS